MTKLILENRIRYVAGRGNNIGIYNKFRTLIVDLYHQGYTCPATTPKEVAEIFFDSEDLGRSTATLYHNIGQALLQAKTFEEHLAIVTVFKRFYSNNLDSAQKLLARHGEMAIA